MNRLFLAFSFLFFTLAARAQRTTDLWYFGQQAGLSFADGNTPKPINDGKMSTYEWDPLESTCRHASLSIL